MRAASSRQPCQELINSRKRASRLTVIKSVQLACSCLSGMAAPHSCLSRSASALSLPSVRWHQSATAAISCSICCDSPLRRSNAIRSSIVLNNGRSATRLSSNARTTLLLGRCDAVSKGRFVARIASSVTSDAICRCSRSISGVGSRLNPSAIQRRALASIAVCLAKSADVTLRGKTTLCTTAADTVPSTISSMRPIAVSQMPPGSSTLGKPTRAAV